ncbi:MAG: hypothetical protein MSIBF_04000 [Candidatus Altiarchaeales archaeon IMC4]|nr:MAG: hypothetical protein MSIBF_04000 [Candidatus Altiarchaeales archaeon IMC4]
MSVMNFKVRRIEAERKDTTAKSIEVKSNFAILTLEKKKDKLVGDYIEAKFKFDAEYTPTVGSLKFEGSVWYQHPNLKEVAVEDGKRIRLKSEAVEELSNAILRECLIEAFGTAKTIGLPMPMKMPSVKVNKDDVPFSKAA